MPSPTRPSSRPGSPSRPAEPTLGSHQNSDLRWNSCHIPAFTSTFGFPTPTATTASPKRDFDAMDTGDSEEPHDAEGKSSLCVRHERLRADYKRLRTEVDVGEVGDSAEEEANLQEILSTLISPDTLPDNEAIQKTFETFAQASHQTRTLILHGLLSTCCYSQLSLLRDKLGESVSAHPGSELSSSQGPPCDTPGVSTSSLSPISRISSSDSSSRGKSRLLALPSPARVDPLIILPLELSARVFSYLDAKDLCTAAQVCKRWKEVSEDDALWKAVYVRTFGCAKAGKARSGGAAQGFFLEGGRDRDKPGEGRAMHPTTATTDRYTAASGTESFLRPTLRALPRHSSWKSDFQSRRSTKLNWAKGVPAHIYSLRPSQSSASKIAITCLQVDWDERIVIGGMDDGTVRVWNLRADERRLTSSGDAETELRCMVGHTSSVSALQFDKVKLITGSLDASMKVWDWRTGRCVRTLTVNTSRPCDCEEGGRSSDSDSYEAAGRGPRGVVCLQFDEDVLVNGDTEGAVRVWDLKRACVETLREHDAQAEVTAVKMWSGTLPSLNPREQKKLVFSASADCTIKLWDVASRSCLRTFVWHLARITSLALVPPASPWLNSIADGPVLVSASLDNSLGVWDVDAGKAIQALLGHTRGVNGVDTDGVRVVSASSDSTVRSWNIAGECLIELGNESKDGKRITCVQVGEGGIVCGMEGEVKVWSFAGSVED